MAHYISPCLEFSCCTFQIICGVDDSFQCISTLSRRISELSIAPSDEEVLLSSVHELHIFLDCRKTLMEGTVSSLCNLLQKLRDTKQVIESIIFAL